MTIRYRFYQKYNNFNSMRNSGLLNDFWSILTNKVTMTTKMNFKIWLKIGIGQDRYATTNPITMMEPPQINYRIKIIRGETFVGQSSKMSLNSQTSYFQFSTWCYFTFKELHFAENPIKIGDTIPKLWPIERLSKQWKTKVLISFVWLYLQINICEFRLILLDHTTFSCLPIPTPHSPNMK